MKEEFYFLGKITKLFGLKGEVVFFMDVDNIEDYIGLGSVFIELNNDKVPFLIENFRVKSSKSATVRLTDVNNIDDAQKFINKLLFLPSDNLPKLKGNSFYFHEIIGFTAIDTVEGEIGKILEVNDQTSQSLLIIQFGKKEFLFPIVEELIAKIDRKNRKVFLKVPEGLLDIYR